MKTANSLITLTTDFGTRDQYVGSLKGSIYTINPGATVSDISHHIPSYDIVHGAYVIGSTCAIYPRRTIHVGVVDPGVGSERLPILIQTENYFFVGPDNGLFSMVLLKEKVVAIYALTNKTYFRPKVSATFHGRDIFSPVAAHLSNGIQPHLFGKPLEKIHTIDIFTRPSVIAIDKFGNAILSFSREQFEETLGNKPFEIKIGKHSFSRLYETYYQIPRGRAGLVFGSTDWLEVAMYQHDAARKLKLRVGQKLRVYT